MPRPVACGLCGSVNILVATGLACPGARRILTGYCQDCGALYVQDKWHPRKDRKTMGEPCPDFLSVPPEHQWTQPLDHLLVHLKEQSMKRRGQWVWYVLPHGALVSMRVNEGNFHRELRIARRTPPVDKKGWDAWRREVDTFLTYLGGRKHFELLAEGEGRADVTYRMLLKGEAPSERCARCGQPAEKGPYLEPICQTCAVNLGREEAAARKA